MHHCYVYHSRLFSITIVENYKNIFGLTFGVFFLFAFCLFIQLSSTSNVDKNDHPISLTVSSAIITDKLPFSFLCFIINQINQLLTFSIINQNHDLPDL